MNFIGQKAEASRHLNNLLRSGVGIQPAQPHRKDSALKHFSRRSSLTDIH